MINLVNLDFNDKQILEKILEWRNDEITRKFSTNTNLITPEIFEKIIGKYQESKIKPLIIEKNNEPVGIITFVESDNKIFIGINISPNYRGQNIASEALNMLIKNNYINNNDVIYAQIKKSNVNSIKLFQKHFRLSYTDEDYYYYERKFNKF